MLRRPPTFAGLYTAAFVVAGWGVGLRPLHDNGFLWHLRTGHLILDSGIPRADPYSFTHPGRDWIAQSWLAELVYAAVDDVAGAFGLRLLTAVATAVVGGLAYFLAMRRSGEARRAAVLTGLALLSVGAVVSERPLLYGLLAFLGLVTMVELPDTRAGRWLPWMLPPLLWIWGNVHGSFVLGIVYLGLHVVGTWLEPDGMPPWEGRSRALVVGTAAGLLLLLANPYGVDLLLFPFHLVGQGEVLDNVVEWQSPDFRAPRGWAYAAWLAAVLVTTARRGPWSRRDLVVALPFLLLGLWSLRNMGIAALVTLPIVAGAWRPARIPEPVRAPIHWAFAGLLVVAAAGLTLVAATDDDYSLDRYPTTTFERLDEAGLTGERLFTTDRWAGYVIATRWPEQHVFLDDRYDMYPAELFLEYLDVIAARPGWREPLDRYDVCVAVVPDDAAITAALEVEPGWRRIADDADDEGDDEQAAAFVRDCATERARDPR